MKFRLKNFSARHYVHFMRRQSKHIQHLHALAFAGIITSLIAGFILYTDYGFWHETYSRKSEVTTTEDSRTIGESWGGFFSEAKMKFNAIGTVGVDLLEGKETFTR